MKIQAQFFILLFSTVILFAACNVTNYYIKTTEKQYSRLGTSRWMDEMDSATIHWRKVGTGSTHLLLLHGFGPMTELQWKKIAKELHENFTLFIPDLIYFGLSTSECHVYDPRFIARKLDQSLKNQHIDEFYIAGISYGGLISSLIAHDNPDRVKGLILIDALSKFLDSHHTDSLARTHGYNDMDEILIPSDGKSLKTLFNISFHKPKNYPSRLLNKPAQRLYANQVTEKKKLLGYLLEKEEEIKTWDFNFKGKTCIIWGEEDRLIPVSNAYELQLFYPNASLTVLPDVGHVANMENPKAVAGVIRAFAN